VRLVPAVRPPGTGRPGRALARRRVPDLCDVADRAQTVVLGRIRGRAGVPVLAAAGSLPDPRVDLCGGLVARAAAAGGGLEPGRLRDTACRVDHLLRRRGLPQHAVRGVVRLPGDRSASPAEALRPAADLHLPEYRQLVPQQRDPAVVWPGPFAPPG